MDFKNKIALNFLPCENQNFSFVIYRKLIKGIEKKPDKTFKSYKLPDSDQKWNNYLISFEKIEGFTEFECLSTTNIYLTKFFLFHLLKENIEKNNNIKISNLKNDSFSNRIHFIIKIHKLGHQTVWLEPYFLKSTSQFGFLIEYDFLKEEKANFDKEIQKLSLSLDDYYRSNKDFYSDKFDYIKNFINNVLPHFRYLQENIVISTKLKLLDSNTLETKLYKFKKNKKSPSQFKGIKEFGPFSEIDKSPNFYFIFTEENIDYARDLYKALNGDMFHTFSGMSEMFGLDFSVSKIKHIIINSYSKDAISKVVPQLANKLQTLAIFIFPENEEEFYFSMKNYLLQYGIVTQGVHIETIKYENKLKWSISSIGLQIFSKLGGIPWRLVPSNENCLIIGIAQSHDKYIDEDGSIKIKKYYSYSVLIDSSGEYISMNVLAETDNELSYLTELNKKLKNILNIYKDKFDKITIHIPYKIKFNEIIKIKDAVESFKKEIEIVVLKINDKSKFFGYNPEHNSLIPYESSFIVLSDNEFLMWSEGLNYHNKKAVKHYANPLYINVYYKNRDNINIKSYLQDILNLTGANWRGFNSKSIPISMFYPKIISKFIKYFDKYKLGDIHFENLPPWFL